MILGVKIHVNLSADANTIFEDRNLSKVTLSTTEHPPQHIGVNIHAVHGCIQGLFAS